MKIKANNITNLISALLFLYSVMMGSPVAASDYFSPRSAGLGGAGHASPLLNDAIFMNPSFASFLPAYSIGASYTHFEGTPSLQTPEYRGRNYSISVQDGRTELFQAGVAYTVREDGSHINVGASKSFIERLGFGLGGKFFFPHAGRPSVQDLLFSTTWAISDFIQAALIVDNIVQSNAGVQRSLYRQIILGTKVNLKGIVLGYLDPHLTPDLPGGNTLGYNAGLEFVVMSDLFLRIGTFRNSSIPFQGSARGNGYGVGLGWIAPRISLDFGISRVMEPQAATSYVFGSTIFF